MALMFHIVFAALGAIMPFMVLGSQWLYLRSGNPVYEAINKKWTTAFALTYATGAVSGTVLTFGFGLFWPTFMNVGGSLMGYPLAIEVLFFLLEAIFLGIYVFGRDQLSPWLHFSSGIPLAIGGFMSMNVVVLGNAWMNTPVGYRLDGAGNVAHAHVLSKCNGSARYGSPLRGAGRRTQNRGERHAGRLVAFVLASYGGEPIGSAGHIRPTKSTKRCTCIDGTDPYPPEHADDQCPEVRLHGVL
jgi:Cytochrome bd terminal oxidase subunit I